MPMRTELIAPIPQDFVTIDRDLLAAAMFSILGLALSFSFMAFTNSFEQIANLASTLPWG